ncbi:MAG TPA: aminodeoxychorismate synthase component I [Pseudonocardia sp.]|nr:aminodeoxychorismate synthase component I [Pseudonocardia sp.]
MVHARFDDLRAETALGFPEPDLLLRADRPDQVVGVLDEVQRATDAGRWAYGYLAYEAAAGLDPVLDVHPAPADGMPLVWFGVGGAPRSVAPLDEGPDADPGYTAHWAPAWSPAEHERAVGEVRARIAEGETYQCNLTVRMRGRVSGDVARLYRDLALTQRGSHNAYLDLGRWVIASASPELFFELRGDDVLLRPMKGTAPRGRDLAEDHARIAELRSSSKERAENIMIVDLMRNDVSRVAEIGSVRVPALLSVEWFETVLQLTSDVTARLRPGTGWVELFRALFPCGSVTGAPKPSTMALIRELEPTPRGVYCGAIGWLGPPDAPVRARFNVAIRTAVVDRATGEAVYGTGGGITYSSDPSAEHAEVLHKAAILDRRHQPFELLETMLCQPGPVLRNLDRHLSRLATSAAYVGFRFDRQHVLDTLTARLAGSGTATRVRLRLRRDGLVTVDVEQAPLPDAGPVRVAVHPEPVDPRRWWLYHKTSMREPYERRRLARPELDDVLLVNAAGELTEATRANLAVCLAGRWYTPPVTAGCLPGVERARLLAAGRLLERPLTVPELARADGLALVSSLRGWRPATLVG